MTLLAIDSGRKLNVAEAVTRAYALWNDGHRLAAEILCGRVVEACPGLPPAEHLQGMIACAHGDLVRAYKHVGRACLWAEAPAHYFSNLAEICRQLDMIEEGERAARHSLHLCPTLADGWNSLGLIFQRSKRWMESVQCLKSALEHNPNSAATIANQGNTFRLMGSLSKAQRCYEQSIALVPHDPRTFVNLANLRLTIQQLDEAANLVQRALRLNPAFKDGYVCAGSIEINRGNGLAVLKVASHLLEMQPDHFAGLCLMALGLRMMELLPNALGAAERAVATAPNAPLGYKTLGKVLTALDRTADAEVCFQRAGRLPEADPLETQLINATLMLETGRGDEALGILDGMLQSNQSLASIWFMRADVKRFTAGDPDIDRMESLLDTMQERPHVMGRLQLHFALGKAYLDIDDDDRAFHHFHTGNRLKRGLINFDAAALEERMQSLAEIFTPSLMERFRGTGDPSSLPIFVVGMPRSGTTMMEQVLSSHPQIHGAGELLAMGAVIEPAGLFPDWLLQATPADIARMGASYLTRLRAVSDGKPFAVDKLPGNFVYGGLIHLFLPNARIIHCRRDPVDSCLSCYTKLFASQLNFTYDLRELGVFYKSYSQLMKHWEAILPSDRFLQVDYEAMIGDLEKETRRIFDFLGIAWDERCLSFHENKRPVRTASSQQVRRPLYTSSAGRWKKYARHLGPLLEALKISV